MGHASASETFSIRLNHVACGLAGSLDGGTVRQRYDRAFPTPSFDLSKQRTPASLEAVEVLPVLKELKAENSELRNTKQTERARKRQNLLNSKRLVLRNNNLVQERRDFIDKRARAYWDAETPEARAKALSNDPENSSPPISARAQELVDVLDSEQGKINATEVIGKMVETIIDDDPIEDWEEE